MPRRAASQSSAPKRDIGPFDKDGNLLKPCLLARTSPEELKQLLPLTLELSDGQSSQGKVTVLSLGEPYIGPQAERWKVKTRQGEQALPLGYKVSFVCSSSTYIGEVVLGGDNGPALMVKREGVQTPVCKVDCVPASSSQTGSSWANVANAVERDSRQQSRQAGHALTGPGIWGMGGPHTAFRAFITDQYQPSESITLHQMQETADAYIKNNNLGDKGWFTAFSQSGSKDVIARLSPVWDTHDCAIYVNQDLSWSVMALQREARKTVLLRHPPKKLHPTLIGPLIDKLSRCRICPGNPDSKFQEVTDVYKDQALRSANSAQCSAKVEEEPFVSTEGQEPVTFTIRACPCDNHAGCDLLLPEDGRVRCLPCDKTRVTLRARQADLRNGKLPSAKPGDRTDLRGHQTERYSHQVLQNGLAYQQAVLKYHQKEAERLRNKSALLGERPLSKRSQEEVEAVFKWCEDNKLIPPQYLDADQKVVNPLRELWDYQRAKQENQKASASPLVFRWCLNMYMHSPSAYNAARQVLELPHEKTLQRVANKVHQSPGLNAPNLQQMADGLKQSVLAEPRTSPRRCVIVALDEMSVVEGIVEDPKTGEWVGFIAMHIYRCRGHACQ